MDEVDGMSGGDRGGVGALNMLIKKTKIPIICIANDSKSQKMRPLQNTTYGLTFKRCILPFCARWLELKHGLQARCQHDQVSDDVYCLQVSPVLLRKVERL